MEQNVKEKVAEDRSLGFGMTEPDNIWDCTLLLLLKLFNRLMIEVTHPDRTVRIIHIGGLSKMSLTEYPCAPGTHGKHRIGSSF